MSENNGDNLIKVEIILVNYNCACETIKCVESLIDIDGQGCRILVIIVDNSSQQESVQSIVDYLSKIAVLQDELDRLTTKLERIEYTNYFRLNKGSVTGILFIRNRQNYGFAAANNIAVNAGSKYWTPDYYWFLNNDTIVTKGALLPLVSKMREDKAMGICGSTLLAGIDGRTVQTYGGAWYSRLTGRGWEVGSGSEYDPQTKESAIERQINYISGAAMFVRSSLFREFGLMCEEYFLYNEEIDLSYRCSSKFRLGVAVSSVVYHVGGASIGTEKIKTRPSSFAAYYQTRSKLIFARKFTPYFLPTVWICNFFKAAKYGVNTGSWTLSKSVAKALFGLPYADSNWRLSKS
jgi:GT2 family glycosyltransferase